MNRLNLFQSAAESVEQLSLAYPDSIALKSVLAQLHYLIEVESGASLDLSMLSQINIGVLAAREVEDRDEGVAMKLYAVSTEAKQMLQR